MQQGASKGPKSNGSAMGFTCLNDDAGYRAWDASVPGASVDARPQGGGRSAEPSGASGRQLSRPPGATPLSRGAGTWQDPEEMRQRPSTLPEPPQVCAFKSLLPTQYIHKWRQGRWRGRWEDTSFSSPSSERDTSFLETGGTKSEGTPPPPGSRARQTAFPPQPRHSGQSLHSLLNPGLLISSTR